MPASLEMPADSRASRIAAASKRRQHAALGAERELRFRQRPCVGDLGQRRAQLALNHGQLDHLGDEDGPGHQRGKGETDHDRLDQHVGRLEHRPWRQFAELGGGGLQQFARARPARRSRPNGAAGAAARRRGLSRLRRLGRRSGGLRNGGRLLNHRRGRRCGAVLCWADDGTASDSIASAEITANVVARK